MIQKKKIIRYFLHFKNFPANLTLTLQASMDLKDRYYPAVRNYFNFFRARD